MPLIKTIEFPLRYLQRASDRCCWFHPWSSLFSGVELGLKLESDPGREGFPSKPVLGSPSSI